MKREGWPVAGLVAGSLAVSAIWVPIVVLGFGQFWDRCRPLAFERLGDTLATALFFIVVLLAVIGFAGGLAWHVRLLERLIWSRAFATTSAALLKDRHLVNEIEIGDDSVPQAEGVWVRRTLYVSGVVKPSVYFAVSPALERQHALFVADVTGEMVAVMRWSAYAALVKAVPDENLPSLRETLGAES